MPKRIYSVPLPRRNGAIYKSDNRSDDEFTNSIIESESVDLIVTSPPYLSVRDYTLDNWIRVWFLGSNKQEEAKEILRTGVIATYETAMKNVLRQMFRVLKWNRACIIVAGDVKRGKKGNIYQTNWNLAKLAVDVGFNVITIFDDDGINLNRRTSQLFNRMYHPEMVDSVPHDSVLILSKGDCPIYDDNKAIYSLDGSYQLTF